MKWFIVVSCLSGLLLAGCAGGAPHAHQEFQNRGLAPSFRAVPQQRVSLPADASQLVKQFVYPDESIRQRFVWSEDGLEWYLSFQDAAADRAGFYLRLPVRPTPMLEDQLLFLEVSPPFGISLLSIALLDESLDPDAVPDVRLQPYLLPQQPDRTRRAFAIPLTAFDSSGDFNWDNLRGIMVRRDQGERAIGRDFVFWNMQLAPRPWIERRWGLPSS